MGPVFEPVSLLWPAGFSSKPRFGAAGLLFFPLAHFLSFGSYRFCLSSPVFPLLPSAPKSHSELALFFSPFIFLLQYLFLHVSLLIPPRVHTLFSLFKLAAAHLRGDCGGHLGQYKSCPVDDFFSQGGGGV